MHPIQHKSCYQQIAVFKTNHIPIILRSRLISIHIGQKTKGEYYDSQVDPDAGCRNV